MAVYCLLQLRTYHLKTDRGWQRRGIESRFQRSIYSSRESHRVASRQRESQDDDDEIALAVKYRRLEAPLRASPSVQQAAIRISVSGCRGSVQARLHTLKSLKVMVTTEFG